MYKLIIIDASAPSSEALTTAGSILALLSDDVLSVSEKETLNPYICCTCDDVQTFTAKEMEENGIEQLLIKPMDKAAIKTLLQNADI